ncbi:MAG: class I SAM-dependent methyltransferase [Anaerolineales bacterium]
MSNFPPLAPSLYHAHHLLRADDLPFWQSLANEYGAPLLELGCGTGRLLLPLAQHLHPLTGLDADPQMLAYLRASLPPTGYPHLQLHQADMRAFHLPERFKLVILPCNTYSTFPGPEREQIAQSVVRHLHPGGMFALSIPNPQLLASLEPFSPFEQEETFPHPETSAPVEVFSQWEKTAEIITFTWRYDHKLPNSSTHSQFAITHHHLDTPEMYLDELQRAGLIPLQTFGDYHRTPFDPDESAYFIILAQKQNT